MSIMFYDCTAHKATRVQLPQQQQQQQEQQEQLTVQQSLTMCACVCVYSQTTLKLLHPLAWEKS